MGIGESCLSRGLVTGSEPVSEPQRDRPGETFTEAAGVDETTDCLRDVVLVCLLLLAFFFLLYGIIQYKVQNTRL